MLTIIMDYKITVLNKQLDCKEQAIPDIPSLMFGTVPDGPLVFDSTAFYEVSELQPIDYKVFQRFNKRYIEGFISNTELKSSELFYQNKDGHILMNHELTFLFLAFANPVLAAYFNGLIGEIMSNGVAYSDGFVYSIAADRMPTEYLKQIINDRENDGKEQA